MAELSLIALILGLIFVMSITRRAARQSETLERIHAGVAERAEWRASEEVIRRVSEDYVAAHEWLSSALLMDSVTYARDLPRYFSGDCLHEYERLVKNQRRGSGIRLVGILRATHTIQVRRFSDDGLTCILIDHQSDRRMATYDYWTKRRLHTQDMLAAVMVYQMKHDRAIGRWRIDRYIQQLPAGWQTSAGDGAALRLTEALPMAAGRDI